MSPAAGLDAKDTFSTAQHVGCAQRIAAAVLRSRMVLVAIWALAALISVPQAFSLLSKVHVMATTPPLETRSAVALAVWKKHFGDLSTTDSETIHIACRTRCESAATVVWTRGIVDELTDFIKEFGKEHEGSIVMVHSYFTYSHYPDSSNPLASKDRQAVLLQFVWNVTADLKFAAMPFAESLHSKVEEINGFQATRERESLQVRVTGPMFMKKAMKGALLAELPRLVLGAMSVPMGIFACRLRSVRIVLFPILSILTTVTIAFAITSAVASEESVSAGTPAMMFALGVGVTLYYSFFMLSNFREHVEAGAGTQLAVEMAMASVGRVILVSATILGAACGSVLVLPGVFGTFCLGSCIIIAVCVLNQLTFLAPLLSLCPPQFTPTVHSSGSASLRSTGGVRAFATLRQEPGAEEGSELLDVANAASPLTGVRTPKKATFTRKGGYLTTKPLRCLVPTCVLLLMSPLTFRCLTMKFGHSFELDMPRTSTEWSLAMDIQRQFISTTGCLFPMLIVATGVAPEVANATSWSPAVQKAIDKNEYAMDVRSQDFFDTTCQLADAIIAGTEGKDYEVRSKDLQGPTFENAGTKKVMCMDYHFAEMAISSVAKLVTQMSAAFAAMWNKTVSKDSDAMLFVVTAKVDPFSPQAFDLVRSMRDILQMQNNETEQAGDLPGLQFMTLSSTSCLMDLIDITKARLPSVVLGFLVLCFAVIAVAFRSLGLPCLLLQTAILPTTWVVGSAAYVYEDGCFGWLHMPGLAPTGNPAVGLCWVAPVFTCTILLGFSVDSTIALLDRIAEFRDDGFSDIEAIQLSLSATSHISNSAGAIFGLSFVGLMLSSIPSMNHMGYVFCVGVLVNAFIVRPFLLPGILSMSPAMCCWPRKTSTSRRTVE